MKLVTDPEAADTVLGYIDDGQIFGFNRANVAVLIGPVDNPLDAPRIIKEWLAKRHNSKQMT